jgi:uncharacterized membrane protein YphA (DoxX/SURF4 family)
VAFAALSVVCFQHTLAAKFNSQPRVVLPQYTGSPNKANQYSHFAKLLAGVLLVSPVATSMLAMILVHMTIVGNATRL